MPETKDLVIDVQDEVWEALVEYTGGGASLCYQCGVCSAVCPWDLVRGESFSVREIIRQAQLGYQQGLDALWLCTTCGQCQAYCPRGVDISELMRGVRYLMWESNTPETGLPSLLWSIYWNNNPWGQPPSQRAKWADGLDVPRFDPQDHEILLYIGCTASYDSRAQRIATALVRVLRAAGVSFGYLGNDEPCCGEAALSVGHRPYFLEVAEATAEVFREKGVRSLVTLSPHCYDVFKNHYPALDRGITVLHYTQYLAQLLESGRFTLKSPLNTSVTFQDPCFLGRHNGEYEAPRRLLGAIPELELVEKEFSGVDGLCCGGGGGRMWLETAPGERFSDLRVRQAGETGAEILVTACPFCLSCLEDSMKSEKVTGIEVLDVVELLDRVASS